MIQSCSGLRIWIPLESVSEDIHARFLRAILTVGYGLEDSVQLINILWDIHHSEGDKVR